MIDRGHELPLIRQAELLGVSRGSLYYEPRPVPAADLAIMRRIDELHLDYPFAGSRMLRDLLRGEGIATGREQVATMMRRMGIEALYRRPHTSKPADGHKIYTNRPGLRLSGDSQSVLDRIRSCLTTIREGGAARWAGRSRSPIWIIRRKTCVIWQPR